MLPVKRFSLIIACTALMVFLLTAPSSAETVAGFGASAFMGGIGMGAEQIFGNVSLTAGLGFDVRYECENGEYNYDDSFLYLNPSVGMKYYFRTGTATPYIGLAYYPVEIYTKCKGDRLLTEQYYGLGGLVGYRLGTEEGFLSIGIGYYKVTDRIDSEVKQKYDGDETGITIDLSLMVSYEF